jgi:2-oxoisovalerate dehydrogenase E1 component alpha subunit
LQDNRSGENPLEKKAVSASSATLLKNLYARMLFSRIVDDCAWRLFEQGQIDFVASARGHEATQVGSAVCIEVGLDFTLPYYRDLGVVLTIGMTPYEVFRTYLLAHSRHSAEGRPAGTSGEGRVERRWVHHWGYQKHNMITSTTPVATLILHAAGVAFACKLRKVPAVTVAYCGDGATTEPDFLEGIKFAAQHALPAVFICEQDCSDSTVSCKQELDLPPGIEHRHVNGVDVVEVYDAMRNAMRHARSGLGPVLLEMHVVRSRPEQHEQMPSEQAPADPLLRCQQLMKEQGIWDEQWASELYKRAFEEIGQALEDAMRDVVQMR